MVEMNHKYQTFWGRRGFHGFDALTFTQTPFVSTAKQRKHGDLTLRTHISQQGRWVFASQFSICGRKFPEGKPLTIKWNVPRPADRLMGWTWTQWSHVRWVLFSLEMTRYLVWCRFPSKNRCLGAQICEQQMVSPCPFFDAFPGAAAKI